MNIRQAKEQIKNAMTAYFAKDSTGEYLMPAYQQRPVFLMGAPGIDKTAIMEQIASEMGIALLLLFHDTSYPPERTGAAIYRT